jgi:type IV pilus assembly protein PilX
MTIQRRFSPASSCSQRGAVLYVALIILILLTLIGIVGMQVATMQERMSSNYLAANQAFQRAEGGVRDAEVSIAANTAYDYEDCATPFSAEAWAKNADDAQVNDVRVRNISRCTGQCSAAAGADESESLCNWYRITAYSRDQKEAEDSSAFAAVDSIYIKP